MTDFDINSDPKTWTTRDGRKVVIYCTDAPGKAPIHGRIEDRTPVPWTTNGSYISASGWLHPFDLISPKRKVKIDFWVNVYPNGSTAKWVLREDADDYSLNDYATQRIACKHIVMEVTEGEFDQ